jgi:hypothetical protein
MNPNHAFNIYVIIYIVYSIQLSGYLIKYIHVVVVIVGKNNKITIWKIKKINQI